MMLEFKFKENIYLRNKKYKFHFCNGDVLYKNIQEILSTSKRDVNNTGNLGFSQDIYTISRHINIHEVNRILDMYHSSTRERLTYRFYNKMNINEIVKKILSCPEYIFKEDENDKILYSTKNIVKVEETEEKFEDTVVPLIFKVEERKFLFKSYYVLTLDEVDY